MQEYWIYYAIAASLCIGCYGFAQKMKAEMSEQSDDGFVLYGYIIMMIVGFLGSMISQGSIFFHLNTILLSALISFFYTIVVKSRLKSLRYLSSSTYFINYRIFSSLWLLILEIFLFSENISFKEFLGIMVGFLVFYLLLEKKTKNESFGDLKKGFFYLFLGSLAISGLQTTNKFFVTSGNNIFEYVCFAGFFGIIFLFFFRERSFGIKKIFEITTLSQGIFLLVSGFLLSFSTVLNNYAYVGGDLAIVYKIISYSLFIPIILSIIIYKEQVTPKKLLAFALTLISILLFI